MANNQDDIGFDAAGRVIAIGEAARDEQNRIVDHPDARPVLIAATLNGDLGVRVFGPPSLALADVLDQLARDYRRAVVASVAGQTQ
jgi:hypothetical protein